MQAVKVDTQQYIHQINGAFGQFAPLVLQYSDDNKLFRLLMMYHRDLLVLRTNLEYAVDDPFMTEDKLNDLELATEKVLGDFYRFIDQI